MRELAISELQMGWVYGAFFWGYLVFQIPGGILGKRYGPRLTLLVAGVIWVLACVLFATLPGRFETSVAGTIALLIAVRVIMGAAHAPIYPVQAAAVERAPETSALGTGCDRLPCFERRHQGTAARGVAMDGSRSGVAKAGSLSPAAFSSSICCTEATIAYLP